MTRIKGYYMAREFAEKLGWEHNAACALGRTLDLPKCGKAYLIPEEEVGIIESTLEDLRCSLRDMRESE
jgi:hypothetical protein